MPTAPRRHQHTKSSARAAQSRYQSSTARRTRCQAYQSSAERLYPGRHPGLPLPEPTDVPPGPCRVMVLAMRVLLGKQLFHPHDCRNGTAVVGAQLQNGNLDISRLRIVSEKGGSVRKAEREAEQARRVVEREELRDALGRVERLASKLFRRAAGLGMRVEKMESRLLGWLHGEAARLLEQ